MEKSNESAAKSKSEKANEIFSYEVAFSGKLNLKIRGVNTLDS